MDLMAIDSGEWFESMWLLWTIREIVKQNRHHRAGTEEAWLARDFRRLVFFANAGTDGILFAFPVEIDVCSPRIMVWHPMEDVLDEVAPSLEDFLRGWLTGTIRI